MIVRVHYILPLLFLSLLPQHVTFSEGASSDISSSCALASDQLLTCVDEEMIAPLGANASFDGDVAAAACDADIAAHEEQCADEMTETTNSSWSPPVTAICLSSFARWFACSVANFTRCAFPCLRNGGIQIDRNCEDYTSIYCVRQNFCNCEDCRSHFEQYTSCMEGRILRCKSPELCTAPPTPAPTPSPSSRRGLGPAMTMVSLVVAGASVTSF